MIMVISLPFVSCHRFLNFNKQDGKYEKNNRMALFTGAVNFSGLPLGGGKQPLICVGNSRNRCAGQQCQSASAGQ